MRVAVVIPAYNNWELTQACVQALRVVTTAAILAEIIVVDDGSTDGVSAAWAAAQTMITPVLLTRNSGFSQACNAGAAAATADTILFLNNDAFAGADSVAALLDVLDSDTTIGIVGSKLLYADGSLQHAGLALLDGPVSRWWHVHRQLGGSLPDAQIARDVFAVTGAALLIRRALFNLLGGFDPAYVNGWEDIDLCLRAWTHGSRVRYEPRSTIVHLESATLGRAHDDRANEDRFIARWGAALASAPRYPLPEIPPIALASRSGCAPDEIWARDHVRTQWSANFGARVTVTRAGSRLARAAVEIDAALARRRPTLEVAWADAAFDAPTGPIRAAFVAPVSSDAATALARRARVDHWWTPTSAAHDALVGAGVAADRVTVVPLGALRPAQHPTDRQGAPFTSVVVAARAADADVLDAVVARCRAVRTMVLDDRAIPDFRDIDIMLARRGGDRWGLLVPAALVNGCRVVASLPLDRFIQALHGVRVVDDTDTALFEAVLEEVADVDALRASAADRARAARRRCDAALATQRIAQTARALVHGSASTSTVAVSPLWANRLRTIGAAVLPPC